MSKNNSNCVNLSTFLNTKPTQKKDLNKNTTIINRNKNSKTLKTTIKKIKMTNYQNLLFLLA